MDEGSRVSFGMILRKFRLAAGLSQEALAERAKMSTDAISALERGARQAPQRQTLALLVAALGLDGDERAEFEATAVRPSHPRNRPAVSYLISTQPRDNLPASLTSFVGRDIELTELCNLADHARLITLIGPGGVGKSRLSVEAARTLQARFLQGTRIVELTPITDGNLVVPAICHAFGIQEQPPAPLIETLVTVLRESRALLVVDNCEHLLQPLAETVSLMLSRCSNLCVIATSREPLRIAGEVLYHVDPLALPSTAYEAIELEEFKLIPAVQLFLDRAQAMSPDFSIGEKDKGPLDTICRRLDGIPLAIELAAARVAVLDISEIADRLEQRFHLLTSGKRTGVAHHRTLRALVDWSYEQLSVAERILFRRLAILAGPWTIATAEHIVSDSQLEASQIFDLMTELQAKSLITIDRTRGVRFGFLQTLREYAQELLHESGEASQFERRHAEYFLNVVIGSEQLLRGKEQQDAVDRITAELDDVRHALNFAEQHPELTATGLLALATMTRYWVASGTFSEGRQLLERWLDTARASSLELGKALACAAYFSINEGNLANALVYARRADAILRDSNDEWWSTYAGLSLLTSCLLCAESVEEEDLLAAHARAASLDDPWLLALALHPLALRAMGEGAIQRGRSLLEEILELNRRTGDPFSLAGCALLLARYVFTRTDPSRAAQLISEAASIMEPRNHAAILALCAESLAPIAIQCGRMTEAALLLGSGRGLRAASGTTQRILFDEHDALRAIASAIGDEQLDALWREGYQMSPRATAKMIMEHAATLASGI